MTSKLRTICSHCRNIVPPRQTCPCRKVSEAERKRREPWRAAYEHPSWRKVRLERYDLVGGLCESCGKPLKGRLHPDGAPWQGDHHIEARWFLDPIAANTVENTRCYCTECHAGARKPKGER